MKAEIFVCLFMSVYAQHLEQYLGHSRTSRNINHVSEWMKVYIYSMYTMH